jgi:hypothetical protein
MLYVEVCLVKGDGGLRIIFQQKESTGKYNLTYFEAVWDSPGNTETKRKKILWSKYELVLQPLESLYLLATSECTASFSLLVNSL